jgi:FlaA1/EpsC-like NDP-sugar epimerase
MRTFLLEHRPQAVFHAAAYKHVPVMEWNVQGAVKNNILGLLTLLDLAEGAGCEHFILISSDKAVNPTSVMGVSKRVGELIIASRPTKGMSCVAVRFGNVLGSNGSVVPVLQKQLRNNQHLTITHPGIRRFFMTTREAVSLVLQAFAIGNHGETLVLDMGTPIRILDLARTMIRLSGKSEHEVSIKFTGLREGEKMFEELFYSNEKVEPTSLPAIKRTRSTPTKWVHLLHDLEELRALLTMNDPAVIRKKLKELVPEYCYPSQASNASPNASEPTVVLREAAGAD